MTPAAPTSQWKPWHKIVLAAVGANVLTLCVAAVFAPDPKAPTDTVITGAQPVATRQATTTAPSSPTPKPSSPSPAPKPSKTPTPKPISYADCADVEAAGKAPIRKGQPGFRKKFDLDGDGRGCELNGDDDPLLQSDDEEEEEAENSTDPRFATCAKANAAGYGPYHRGVDPEYSWYRDRDGDGTVCER